MPPVPISTAAGAYKLTVPLPVPGKLFWSVTVYDAQTRSQVQTDEDNAALRRFTSSLQTAQRGPMDQDRRGHGLCRRRVGCARIVESHDFARPRWASSLISR